MKTELTRYTTADETSAIHYDGPSSYLAAVARRKARVTAHTVGTNDGKIVHVCKSWYDDRGRFWTVDLPLDSVEIVRT
jgi:hypothetical protein